MPHLLRSDAPLAVYGRDPPDTKYGFEADVSARYFSTFANKDVAFCHHESKTLITADLLFNLPPTEQVSRCSLRCCSAS